MSCTHRGLSCVLYRFFLAKIPLSASGYYSLLFLDNSPLAYFYDQILTTPVTVASGAGSIDKPLLLWINDGLMAVFTGEIRKDLDQGAD